LAKIPTNCLKQAPLADGALRIDVRDSRPPVVL
jgi:hypothetical protein